MKTLIIYHSKYWSTETCVKQLVNKLNGDVSVMLLWWWVTFSITDFDTIIIGWPIYMSRLEPIVVDFCQKNIDSLMGKKLGFFYCAMSSAQIARWFFENSIPKKLLESAAVTSYFGWEIHFEKMNFIKRFFVKKILEKNPPAIETIQENEISRFASFFS